MALIPPHFLDCVVAIGVTNPQGQRRWIASGFLYGSFKNKDADGKEWYRIYLVTNRHVVKDFQNITLRFNPRTNEPAREFTAILVDQNGTRLWYPHPEENTDVAVIPINAQMLEQQNIQFAFFRSNSDAANVDRLNQLGVTEGDFAYVLGFPVGLVGDTRNTVIVRSGTIARVRDALARANRTFLVDAFTFPGNSGGPVISKPEVLSIQGTQSQNTAFLIGIVTGYRAYQERAISEQTGNTRIIFEDNSGLSEAHPVDFIDEAIREHIRVSENQPPTTTQS